MLEKSAYKKTVSQFSFASHSKGICGVGEGISLTTNLKDVIENKEHISKIYFLKLTLEYINLSCDEQYLTATES